MLAPLPYQRPGVPVVLSITAAAIAADVAATTALAITTNIIATADASWCNYPTTTINTDAAAATSTTALALAMINTTNIIAAIATTIRATRHLSLVKHL